MGHREPPYGIDLVAPYAINDEMSMLLTPDLVFFYPGKYKILPGKLAAFK